MRIARKLAAVVGALAVVVSMTAICPCLPAAPYRAAQAAADEHACCSSGSSPSFVAAAGSCFDHALTDRSAATSSAGASLGADTGIAALTAWTRSEIRAAHVPPTVIVSHAPSVLRI